jgi:hypothetical protein
MSSLILMPITGPDPASVKIICLASKLTLTGQPCDTASRPRIVVDVFDLSSPSDLHPFSPCLQFSLVLVLPQLPTTKRSASPPGTLTPLH